MRALLAVGVIAAAFAAPFAVVGLTGDDGPTPATARTVSGFPLERVAEHFEPPARTAVVRKFRAVAPLPTLRRQRSRRAPTRPAVRGDEGAAAPAASPPSSSDASQAATSAPAPAPAAPPPVSAPAPARTAPPSSPAGPSRPAPDDFDSGESFDSSG